MPHTRTKTILVFALTTVVFYTSAAGADVTPDRFLSQTKGLTRLGHFWVCRTEVGLRRRLELLPKLEREVLARQQDLKQAIDHNAQRWRQLGMVEASIRKLEEAIRRTPGNGAARRKLEKDLQRQRETFKRLRAQAIEPTRLGGNPQVAPVVVALINARQALAVSLFRIRQDVPALAEQYRVLKADADVSRALTQLGNPHRLGPARRYETVLKSLGRYEKLVFTEHVPVYRESDRLRVGLIVNERYPATFTWRESSEPTIITASLAESAGIEVAADAPTARLTVGRNRQLIIRSTKIRYIRLGKYVFPDVSAYVLPPEGEDLGSQIGQAAMEGCRVVIRPEQLRLAVEPQEREGK